VAVAMICPLCSSPVESRPVRISLDDNSITIAGIKFSMSPQETEFLTILDRKRGEFVSTSEIVAALWGGGDIPVGADQIMARYAADIRRFAEPFGVKIEGVFARGYRLVAR
jgi:DNA-binding response OmpR family regulator